jgi:hypothetical protein
LASPLRSKVTHFRACPCFGRGPFKSTAPAGGGAVGEIVRFEEKNGKMTRMVIGDTWADRVNGY